jgi:hypothetical protein
MFIYGINGRRTWVELQAPDEGGGGGDDSPTDKVLKGIESLLKRHGNDSSEAIKTLYTENKAYRDEIRDLKAKVPAEGAIILTGDDAVHWAAYKTLGKPEEIKQGLDEKTQLQGKLQGLERDSILRNVAETAGYKPTVLMNLDHMAKSQGKMLAYEVREVTQDGKPVKVAYVKDGDKELPISDYATATWGDFLPALTNGQSAQQSGTRFLTQHVGGGGGKTNLVDTFLQEQEAQRAAVKNPLIKS